MVVRVVSVLFAAFVLLPSHAHAQPDGPRVVRADLAVSADGALAVTSTGTGTLLLWDAATWTLRRRHTGDGTVLLGFDVTPDGRYVSFGGRGGRLVVLEVATGAVVFETQDREGSVSATRFGAGDTLFAAGQGRLLTSYNWRTGAALRTYDLGREIMPDGRRLVVEDFEVLPEQGWLFVARFDQQARLMDVATGAVLHSWRNKARPRDGHRNVKDVAVLPDGRTGVFAGVGGDVVFVDLLDGTRLDSVRVHPDFVSDLALRPDGRVLAATDLDGRTTLIDPATRTVTRRFRQAGSFPSGRLLFAVAFRPGTDEVITGGIRLPIIAWDATTGARRRTIAALP
jgi:WD40 repeat protein